MAANFGMNEETLAAIIGSWPFAADTVVEALKDPTVVVGRACSTGRGCCGSWIALGTKPLPPPVETMETGIAW